MLDYVLCVLEKAFEGYVTRYRDEGLKCFDRMVWCCFVSTVTAHETLTREWSYAASVWNVVC